MVFGGSGLIRGGTNVDIYKSLIRGVVFGGSGLIRGGINVDIYKR